MSEEIKIETKEESCKCLCKSVAFKNILTIATGSFIGVFCALSLFAALHKPPIPHPCPMHGPMMRPPMMQQPHHFKYHKDYKNDFHKKMEHKKFPPKQIQDKQN